MPKSTTDRNLLFGILALQMDFIARDALIAAMHAWVLEKAKPLGQILLEQKALTADTHALLEALVQKHLALHGNDAEKSLAAVSSVGSVRNDLEQIADPDVQASLVHVAADPYATVAPPSVGTPTSDGLRFRILRPHARGGLGEVFVAHDEELHREVALKEIQNKHADHPESRARFLLEAEITGGLEHPGIVPVYGLGTYADGRPFYAMRFIRGDSLQDAIKRYHQGEPGASATGERTLELRKLLGRLIDVCNALQYAHDRGVLHRDIKPGNIMLGKYGETLVVDWGLAKALGEPGASATGEKTAVTSGEARLNPTSSSGSAETIAGTAIGTPAYMSPEQAEGRLDILGPASDVYSLGATLYTLLTGKTPVDGRLDEVMKKVRTGEITPPRRLNPMIDAALEAVCIKAMALRPADRYESPRRLADDLEHWLAGEPVTAYREPLPVRARRWARNHKPLVTGVAVALLFAIVGGGAAAIWHQFEQAEATRKQALVEAETARKNALAEEKIRQAFDNARNTLFELHKTLARPGGVQELLNRPEYWQFQITSARADWQRAKDHLDGAPDERRAAELGTLNQKLTRDQADYELAVRLEEVRMDRAAMNHEKRPDRSRAKERYPAVFAGAGLAFAPGQQRELALLIQQSAIKDQLVAALDDWGLRNSGGGENSEITGRVLEVVRLADPDPWRNRVRDPGLWKNKEGIAKLAQEVQADGEYLAQLSPQMLVLVSDLLPMSQTKDTWLRTAQALHPADFWINLNLSISLAVNGNPTRGLGFLRVALAIRPHNAMMYLNLGSFLYLANDSLAATDAFKNSLAIDPNYAPAWCGLAAALSAQKNFPEAIDAYKKALAIDPNSVRAWSGLGATLRNEKKDIPTAIAAIKKALAIDPDDADAWTQLGIVLFDQNDLPAAVDAYKKALASEPRHVDAWICLGNALQIQKDIPGAIDAYKKALAINLTSAKAWNGFGAALLRQNDFSAAITPFQMAVLMDRNDAAFVKNLAEAQRLLVLDKKLPGVLRGDAATRGELLDLADFSARYKGRYRDAVKLYASVFATDPLLVSVAGYNAACYAAMAAWGKGSDRDKLDANEQSRLRKQAFYWLQPQLDHHVQFRSGNPVHTHQTMEHWKRDSDLAGVRDVDELDKLPENERKDWQKFWAKVEQTRKDNETIVVTRLEGALIAKQKNAVHEIKMTAGKTYSIDMDTRAFRAFLKLQDTTGKLLREYLQGENSNYCRIVFTPKQEGTYRLLASSFQEAGGGAYTITVRALVAERK